MLKKVHKPSCQYTSDGTSCRLLKTICPFPYLCAKTINLCYAEAVVIIASNANWRDAEPISTRSH